MCILFLILKLNCIFRSSFFTINIAVMFIIEIIHLHWYCHINLLGCVSYAIKNLHAILFHSSKSKCTPYSIGNIVERLSTHLLYFVSLYSQNSTAWHNLFFSSNVYIILSMLQVGYSYMLFFFSKYLIHMRTYDSYSKI